MRKRILPILLILAVGAAGYYFWQRAQPHDLVLTGIVTTNDVLVSPLTAGQIAELKQRLGVVGVAADDRLGDAGVAKLGHGRRHVVR